MRGYLLRMSSALALIAPATASPALATPPAPPPSTPLAPSPSTTAPSPAAATAATPRRATALADGWRFRFGAEGDAPANPDFDDSGWQTVSVPHSWNRIGAYAEQRDPRSDNRQGIGWYRLAFDAPAVAAGQRSYLDFAAVSKIADVWVNGVHVGRHAGAFSRFRLDVTAAWKPGGRNVIAVRADNSKPAAGQPTGETIPLSGDFFVHGGIYRPVQLLTVADAGIDLLDHGGPGIYARATNVTAGSAEIKVLSRLRNLGSRTRNLDLAITLRDAAGGLVVQTRQAMRLARGAGEAEASLSLPSPRLWNGRADPYLYSVTVDVIEKGRTIDSVTQPLGIRTFAFDANEGFALNGRHIKLHGVSRHQDRPDKGWALTPADHAQDMALIAEMGANTVRQAHYQHADEWSDEADRAGMVVWAELPYVTTPGLAGGKGSPELWANAEQQLRELIRQNWNHPSIVMWSIGNEVDSAKGFGQTEPVRPLALLQRLNALAKQEDPTRATTFADCCEDLGMVDTAGEKLAGTADLIGYNRYFGWYYPQPLQARAQLGAMLDRMHAKHPSLPISISEYGAGGAISQHSDDVQSGFLNFIGRPQPEEFESFVHEQSWPAIRDRKFVFASWVWNMFDFASDLRDEGDSVDLNTKGLVTADRQIRKDAFWYYKAQWSTEPVLALTGKRHAERPYPVIDIKAYSNADRAMLTLNGESKGEVPCPDRICVWPAVSLQPGANHAVVTATAMGTPLRDEATWTAPDPAHGIRIAAGNLASRVINGKRFGSDTFVTGGKARVLNMGGFGGRRAAPPRAVSAAEPRLFDYWREGDAFSYAIPVPDGTWTVTIHTFAPTPAVLPPQPASDPRAAAVAGLTTPTTGTMSVTANGKLAVPPFNIIDAAGGVLKGVSRSFRTRVKNGVLKLDFAGQGGQAIVSAIEVTK